MSERTEVAKATRTPLLCSLGLHRFTSPGCEPFFSVWVEDHCLRCTTPSTPSAPSTRVGLTLAAVVLASATLIVLLATGSDKANDVAVKPSDTPTLSAGSVCRTAQDNQSLLDTARPTLRAARFETLWVALNESGMSTQEAQQTALDLLVATTRNHTKMQVLVEELVETCKASTTSD
jgi:hypothetical protein